MIKNKLKGKIIFFIVLFLYAIFILSGVAFAEMTTVYMYPSNYTIHNYKNANPNNDILDGTSNVAHNDIDEVWYYVIPNYNSWSMEVVFDMYGPVTKYGTDKTYVKNLHANFKDTIPGGTARMYFYTVFTADKSYEASELHSADIALDSNGVIYWIGNFRSIAVVGMGDDGDDGTDVNYYLNKEEIESTGQHHYGYPDESGNPHYIQFLYPDVNNKSIKLHEFVQTGTRPIGTPYYDRSYIISELSGFNGYEAYTSNGSPSVKHFYYNSYAGTVNPVILLGEGASDISRETLGHIVMTYDKQIIPPDTTPPTVSIWPETYITNRDTIRVFLSATDDSGIDWNSTGIYGFHGAEGAAYYATGRSRLIFGCKYKI